MSAPKGNFHEQQWLQLNQHGKTHQEHNAIALRNCKHNSLSSNIIFFPSAKLYGACHQTEAAGPLIPAELL